MEEVTLNKSLKLGSKDYMHDITKATFSKLSKKEKKDYKKQILKKLQSIVDFKLKNVIKRYLNLNDLPVVEKKYFFELVEQAKQLYILGYDYTTVALCGVIGENICRVIIENSEIYINKKKLNSGKQFSKFEFYQLNKILISTNLITQESFKNLEKVRKLRNDYMHGKGLTNKNECNKNAKMALNCVISTMNCEFKPEA